MAFQQSDIGPRFDLGLATRDGSTLTCIDENGASKALSQVAYMFSTKTQDQVESTNLVRKDELVRLSSSNVIDREFQSWPQATQGNWVGGELQKIFTDPTAYYQGRGLPWPLSAITPTLPTQVTLPNSALVTPVTAVRSAIASGFSFFVFAYVGNGVEQLQLQDIGSTPTQVRVNPAGPVTGIAVIYNTIYFTIAGSTNIYVTQYSGGALSAPAIFGTAPANGMYLNAFAGPVTPYLVVWGQQNTASRIFSLTSLTVAAGSTDLTTPQGFWVTSTAMSGGQLYQILTDAGTSPILLRAYDISAQTSSAVASLTTGGYLAGLTGGGATGPVCATIGSAVFVLIPNYVNLSFLTIDLYLVVGGSAQYIGSLPPIATGNSGGTISYSMPATISSIAVYNQFALFAVKGGFSAPLCLYAYDVARGTLYRVSDQITMTSTLGGYFPIAVYLTPASTSFIGDNFAWGVAFVNTLDRQIQTLSIGRASGTSGIAPGNGGVISSLIDFTSASVKLFRQVVVRHPPVASGQSVTLSVWLDQTPDALSATPQFTVTHTYSAQDPTPAQTTLLLNKLAVKLVYQLDWVGVPPVSVVIQAAVGWVWKTELGISDSAKTNAQNTNDFCFQKQGIDAKAAYNFARQLWRQKGGQCVLTSADGDQYNAQIESIDFASPKPGAPSLSGDRKTRYEVVAKITVREDL